MGNQRGMASFGRNKRIGRCGRVAAFRHPAAFKVVLAAAVAVHGFFGIGLGAPNLSSGLARPKAQLAGGAKRNGQAGAFSGGLAVPFYQAGIVYLARPGFKHDGVS